ncbi:hypothetical protein [Parvularcula marina]|jgi:hypothetical protein|uniref:hypothetical protein n=1 Tax=Parvularcula marina TaxID=2292771 RepID=UPI0013143F02|nr:hypothetical protein [Parvularcula marina]
MTAIFDRAFVALGVDAHDLTSVKGRSAIYLGLMAMAVACLSLVGGICSNLVGGPVA